MLSYLLRVSRVGFIKPRLQAVVVSVPGTNAGRFAHGRLPTALDPCGVKKHAISGGVPIQHVLHRGASHSAPLGSTG